MQGSLALFQLRKIEIKGAVLPRPGSDPTNLEIESSPSLPVFAAATFAFGKPKGEYGNRQAFQIAISAFQTYNEQLGGDVRFSDSFGRTNSIQFFQVDRETYLGVGFGWPALKRFLVGLNIFAQNRNLDHAETLSLAFGGRQNPTEGSPCPTNPQLPFCVEDARQINRATTFNLSAWHLVFRLGLMQLIGKRWRLGLMFQPPGIPVGGKSDLRFELSDVNAQVDPAPSTSALVDVSSNANSPVPWILRLGTSYVLTKRAKVALDLQFVGPVRSGRITDPPPGVDLALEATGVFLVGDRSQFRLEHFPRNRDRDHAPHLHSIRFPHRQLGRHRCAAGRESGAEREQIRLQRFSRRPQERERSLGWLHGALWPGQRQWDRLHNRGPDRERVAHREGAVLHHLDWW